MSNDILEDKYCSICHRFIDDIDRSDVGFCCKSCFDLLNINLIVDDSLLLKDTNISVDKNKVPIHSVYIYQNMIRDLILRVKIKKDFIALNIIKDLFLIHIDKTGILNNLNVDEIIPIPSSLWSRIRGKFDIAYFLADALSKHINIPLRKAPMKLGWNIVKRSKIKSRKINKDTDKNKDTIISSEKKTSNILIIDDIITTGDTLKKICSYYHKNNINFISFSKSYNFNQKYIELD